MKNLTRSIALILTAASLSACLTAQDKALADSLDCEGLSAMQKSAVNSPRAIVAQWDEDRYENTNTKRQILNQSRDKKRDSYMRRQYASKC